MPEIPERAPVLSIEKRTDFLGDAGHRSYIARPGAPMKCLATYGDGQMLAP
jgi:hypothetical protein